MDKRALDLTYKDLQTFLAVAEASSFSDAAENLNISQPSISNRMKVLEEKIQRQLIIRDTRSVSLTHEGERFKEYATKAISALSELYDEFHVKGKKRASKVTVVAPMFGSVLIPPRIATFQDKHIGIKIILTVASGDETIDLVAKGKCDMGIIAEHTLPPELYFEPLLSEQCQVIAPIDHPLLDQRTVEMADLLKYPILSPDVHIVLRNMIILEAEKLGVEPIFVPGAFEVGNFVTVLAMVQAGLGICIYPTKIIPEQFLSVVGCSDIADCNIERVYGLILPQNHQLSSAANLFANELRSLKTL
ncbi:hypothetical protein C8024_05995 [Sphingopyxis sp. BSNA05]|uniref:LysR family transcriptional regulator n=1 Tax=Sphingopyxis sp. BSNA05 TaxID=1236614 RepID=UPI001C2704F1|nr:LysR family transcriptional regulator [Sphingopyxis sp. BSNA05]NRD89095.1 hypothetical protein [Sphingopyxis sp. BSNA05]